MDAMVKGEDGVWRFTSPAAELFFMQGEKARFEGRGTPKEEWPEWLRDYPFPMTEQEAAAHTGVMVHQGDLP